MRLNRGPMGGGGGGSGAGPGAGGTGLGRGGGAVSGSGPAPACPAAAAAATAWGLVEVDCGSRRSVAPPPLREGASGQVSAGGGPSARVARGADSRRNPPPTAQSAARLPPTPAGAPRPWSGPRHAGRSGPRVQGSGYALGPGGQGWVPGARRGRRAPHGLCPPAFLGRGRAHRCPASFPGGRSSVPRSARPEVAAGAGSARPLGTHRVGPGSVPLAFVGSALRGAGSRTRFLPLSLPLSRRHSAA